MEYTKEKIRDYVEQNAKGLLTGIAGCRNEETKAIDDKWMQRASEALNKMPEIEAASDKQCKYAEDLRFNEILNIAAGIELGVTSENMNEVFDNLASVRDAKTLIEGLS